MTTIMDYNNNENTSVMFFLIPFHLQAVHIHSANGVKLVEA
jgi:hypothetical protein